MFNSLGFVDVLLGYALEGEEVVFVDDEVDWAQLATAYLHFWILINNDFLRFAAQILFLSMFW